MAAWEAALALAADISACFNMWKRQNCLVMLQGGSIGGGSGTGGGNRAPAAVAEVSEEEDGEFLSHISLELCGSVSSRACWGARG